MRRQIIDLDDGTLFLYLSGRRSAADVELSGDPEAVSVVSGARLGL